MKLFKKTLALTVAGILIFSGLENLSAVNADTASLHSDAFTTENSSTNGVSMEFGLSYDKTAFTDTSFNGSDIYEVDESSIELFKEHIKNASSIDLSVTFKLANAATDYISLLEISDTNNNSSSSSAVQSTIAVIVSKSGVVYFETGSNKNGTDWQNNTGVNIADGQFHTLNISISSGKMVCQMDGGAKITSDDTTEKGTRNFVTAFLGGTADGYTDWRPNINSIAIGGLTPDSYFKHPNYSNLNGEISQISISGVNDVSDITGGRVTTGMFDASIHDNTWLFGGGVETQGRFREIAGVRNYMGHFEEYIRWEKRINSVLEGMQRYTINAAKEGQDAVMFAKHLNDYIERALPRAVVYAIGPEDYHQGENGIDAFQNALEEIIDISLKMKQDENGAYHSYLVLQLPHAVKDAKTSQLVRLYANAARNVVKTVAEEDSDQADRILLVDHLSLTDNNEFLNNMLTKDGLLNADGHYEIAKQLAQSVCGSANNFPALSDSWTAEEAPAIYSDIPPTVTSSSDSLTVAIPQESEIMAWNYILSIDGVSITGSALGNPFTIRELPADKQYKLTVLSKDNTTQYSTVSGTIADGSKANASQYEGAFQDNLRKLLAENDSLTWLFMGDSITHAAAHTHGYDGIAQIFEKYIKEDLARTDDLVINTAVSGATCERTLQNIEQRMGKYKADIVSVMLGTNDTVSSDVYASQLREIVSAIKESNPDAMIVFRTPTPAKNPTYAGRPPKVAEQMKAIADNDANILLIDQYTQWNQEFSAYPYLYTSGYYFGDGSLHPGSAGQLRMFQQFVTECGLNTNTLLSNLAYQFSYTRESSDERPEIVISDTNDSITVSRAAVSAAYEGGQIGDYTVVLTDAHGKSYEKNSGLNEDEITIHVPSKKRYAIKITANIKGNSAKHVTFAEWEIPLTSESQTESDEKAASDTAKLLDSISSYDDVTKYEKEIKALRTAYESLTDIQKLLIPNNKLSLLLDAENAINQHTAENIIRQILQLKTIEDTDEYCEKAFSAHNAYNAITREQKQLISDDVKNILFEAVDFASDQQAAKEVIAKIHAIGTVLATTESLQKITAARTAYNALSDKQKQFISAEIIKILTDAETAYANLKNQPDDVQILEGKFYENNGYFYKITSIARQKAEIVGIQSKTASHILVPDTVDFDSVTYKVTAISASAFKNCKKASGATIGKNVETIGDSAFAGCSKLKKATIKSSKLKTIGKKTFMNCKVLKNIIIKSKVLNKVGKNTWKGIHKNAKIKVPAKKLKAYAKILSNKGQGKKVQIIK